MNKDGTKKSNQRTRTLPKSRPIPNKQPGRPEVFNTPERRSVDRNTSLEIKRPPEKK